MCYYHCERPIGSLNLNDSLLIEIIIGCFKTFSDVSDLKPVLN